MAGPDAAAERRPSQPEAGGTMAAAGWNALDQRWRQASELRALDSAAEGEKDREEQPGSQTDSKAADSAARIKPSPQTRASGELEVNRSDGDTFIASGLVTLSLRYDTCTPGSEVLRRPG